MTSSDPGDEIRLDIDGTFAVVTIDRPARRNALNLAALDALDARLDDAEAAGVRCLAITGADGHFCAGADLTELEDLSFTLRLREVLDHLAGVSIPTFAAIEGSCMGLGMQLALACDVRFASADAKFAVPVAKLGLMVDQWTLRRLAEAWGQGAARLMVLGAEVYGTDDALRHGFVQRVGTLEDVRAIAARVAGLAPLSISGSKLGLDLIARGVIPAGLLNGLKARLLLAFALRAGWEPETIRAAIAAYG